MPVADQSSPFNRLVSKIGGRLLANRDGAGGVVFVFAPNRGASNMRPLHATSSAEAEADLVEVFEFKSDKAKSFLQMIASHGQADAVIAIDEAKLSALVIER